MSGWTRLAAGYGIGAASYLAGIMISAVADLPTGAVTVWTMALISVLTGFAIGRWQLRILQKTLT
jgi:ABC-type Mn2+/Zn2+ transport system permease subunit